MSPTGQQVAALDEVALGWARRAVWAVCIGVYLTVFVGGIQGGGAELLTMARAAGFTLAAAVLGRVVVSLLASAALPVRQGRMAEQDGPNGSPIDPTASTNVAQHFDDRAGAA